MISTGTNDLKRWNLRDKKYARDDFLAGNSLEVIGKKCNRHAKNVCIELMRQGLIEEKDNISKNHTRFESGSDTCSEYTPSDDESCDQMSDSSRTRSNTDCSEYIPSEDEDYEEDDGEDGEDEDYEEDDGEDEDYEEDDGEDEDYEEDDGEDEEDEDGCDQMSDLKNRIRSDSDSEYIQSDEEYDVYNIEQNIDNIYKIIDGFKSYISKIRKS